MSVCQSVTTLVSVWWPGAPAAACAAGCSASGFEVISGATSTLIRAANTRHSLNFTSYVAHKKYNNIMLRV